MTTIGLDPDAHRHKRPLPLDRKDGQGEEGSGEYGKAGVRQDLRQADQSNWNGMAGNRVENPSARAALRESGLTESMCD